MATGSYWKSYRKIRTNVNEHLKHIYSESDQVTRSESATVCVSDTDTDGDASDGAFLNSFVCAPSSHAYNSTIHTSEIINGAVDLVAVQNIPGYTGQNNVEFEDSVDLNTAADNINDRSIITDLDDFEYSSDSSSADNNSLNTSDDLAHELGNWASKFNIPHNAIRDLLGVLHTYHPHLPKDPRTILNTPSQTKYEYEIKQINGGSYYHFGLVDCIRQELLKIGNANGILSLSIQINIDGLPLFKSSSTQFWPILGRIVKPHTTKPFIVGLFVGQSKPGNVQEYLHDFVDECRILQEAGLKIPEVHHIIQFNISCVICDTPARAFVKQVKGHSGYYGCDKCTQKGIWKGKMTFPETNANLRTDEEFGSMRQAEHHIGLCPLKDLDLGLVTQFPLDYMHLVCLGVVKRIIHLWMKGPLHCRPGAAVISQISEHLLEIRTYLPREFLRKGRSLREVDRWKATEFRLFLLYTGPVVLKACMPKSFYDNFLCLFVSIFCLCSPLLCVAYNQYAHELLCVFVQEFGRLYGDDQFVYNLHGLTHLAADVTKFGALDNYSSFVFESFLGNLKRLIRKPNFPLQQVIRRLGEKQNLSTKEDPTPVCGTLRKQHRNGPVTRECSSFSQYRELSLPDVYLSVNRGDNCVLVGDKVGLVRNILCADGLNGEKALIVEFFRGASSFFEKPLKSSDLRIFAVSKLREQISFIKLKDITCKCVLMPHRDRFIAVPLIHNFV